MSTSSNNTPSKVRTTRLSLLSTPSANTPQSPRKTNPTSQIPIYNNSNVNQAQPPPQLVTVHEDHPITAPSSPATGVSIPFSMLQQQQQQQHQQQQQPPVAAAQPISGSSSSSISNSHNSVPFGQQVLEPQQQQEQPVLPRAATAPVVSLPATVVVSKSTGSNGNEILTMKSNLVMNHAFHGKMSYDNVQKENNMLAVDREGNLVFFSAGACPSKYLEFYMTREKEDEILESLKDLCSLYHPDVPFFLRHNLQNIVFPFYCSHCKFEHQDSNLLDRYLDKTSYEVFVTNIIERINQRIDETGIDSKQGGRECTCCGASRTKLNASAASTITSSQYLLTQ